MGLLDKIVFNFDQSWWPKPTHLYSFFWKPEEKKLIPKEDEWTTKIVGISSPMGSKKALTVWTMGENAKLVSIPRVARVIKLI